MRAGRLLVAECNSKPFAAQILESGVESPHNVVGDVMAALRYPLSRPFDGGLGRRQ